MLAWANDAYGDVIARTMGMTTFALFRLFSSLETADEDESLFGGSILANKPLLVATGLSVLSIILATELGFLQRLLGTASLSIDQWAVCIVVPAVAHRGRGGAQAPQGPDRRRAGPDAGGRGRRCGVVSAEGKDQIRGEEEGQKAEKGQARRDDAVAQSAGTPAEPAAKMKTKDYEREMRRLHGELVAMQEWVKATGAKVCIVFEGRDTAGKGGTIKRITERVSPRVFKVVALSAPTEREKSQMYVQRYMTHFPAAGEVVIFDRSWYNRAGVERVMGFCTPEQTERFLEQVPAVEKAMVDNGIILIKYWLEVSPEEQTRRLEGRIHDPRKTWKLTDMDLKSYGRWDDYSRARTRCSPRPTRPGRRGGSPTRTTRSAAGSTSSATCSAGCPMSPLEPRDVELPKRKVTAKCGEPNLP